MLPPPERDCSVQRRYQKVVEVAPSIGLPDKVVKELCDAGVQLAEKIGYDNAGTVEFLLDQDTNEWFFIEMNPRIQVEHTVTEQITGIDIVRSQILVAMDQPLHGKKIGIPAQESIPRNGCAVQCRVTTEDPEKGFTPEVVEKFKETDIYKQLSKFKPYQIDTTAIENLGKNEGQIPSFGFSQEQLNALIENYRAGTPILPSYD